MRRAITFAGRLVLLAAYACLFGELFLRAFAPQPLVPRYVTSAPDGVRANMRNVRFRQWTPEVDVHVAYNDAGMRDDRPAPPPAKHPGECRVALLGDSYFVGFESDYANTFAWKLEQDLRAAGHPCRVLNFAVSGFGTAEMLIAYEHRVRPYHPDLVVASWHQSDPNDNVRSQLYRVEADGRLVRANATYLPAIETSDALMRWGVYRWLIENSHLYSAARERIAVAVKALRVWGAANASEGGDGNEAAPAVGAARPGTEALDEALIRALAAGVRADGARFLLFSVPRLHDRTHFSSPLDMLDPAELPGVQIVSPLQAFTDAADPARKLYWEQGHRHWTPAGSTIAARVAADTIMEWHLLGGGPDGGADGGMGGGAAR